jgi:acetoacetyl-CoA synthetase
MPAGNQTDGHLREGDVLWRAPLERRERAQLTRYRAWLARELKLYFADYESLHGWSIADPDAFWRSIWAYFDVQADGELTSALVDAGGMFRARWFEGARVNYAEHLLRHEAVHPHAPAICFASECQPSATISRAELGDRVRRLANALRALGIGPGDRVASYMPNIPETAVAMMATVAIGAVWTAAAPEFGTQTVVDRFLQIEPKLLFAVDGYRFAGKVFDRREQVAELASRLPSLEAIIWLPLMGLGDPPATSAQLITHDDLLARASVSVAEFRYERVSSDHPLWILFSSGTTGIPKAIVHSHAGVLSEQLKSCAFHLDLGPGSKIFIYSTPGWMMWNTVLGSLLTGACAILYDGSPACDGPQSLWSTAAATEATLFGISPAFVQLTDRAGVIPSRDFQLPALETLLLGGSPSSPEIYDWLYRNVKQDMWVCAPSGGTELVSAFVSGDVTAPVRAGEIQVPALGMDVRVWNEAGENVVDEVGELVVTNAFPSAPLCFWGDRDGRRFHESYFEYFPGVWRHGDIAKESRHGGFYIYGRSDSTLNRFGVRIGTAEIYAIVGQLERVVDSLIVCADLPDGGFYMPLFVKVAEGDNLTPELADQIRQRLRIEGSPRHVPDEIVAVPGIPYTLTGKKMEVPVRKLLMGMPPEKIISRDAMAHPDLLDWYIDFAKCAEAASPPDDHLGNEQA